MSGKRRPSGILADAACRRWPDMPDLTLAKYLSKRHPDIYGGVEGARNAVRFARGKKIDGRGWRNPGVPQLPMPQSLAREKTDWIFPDGRWLLMGDLHIPFHDMAAINRSIADAKAQGVNGVFLCGDVQDCAAIGLFHNADVASDFLREIENMIDFLDFLRGQFRGMPIVWQPGNHEERLESYYNRLAPEIADLPTADMAVCLGLEKRGITMLPRRQRARVKAKEEAGDLHVVHGHTLLRGLATPVSPARTAMLKAKANVVIAHAHRASYQPEHTIGNRALACWSIGCQCSLAPDYNPDANNWNHAHAILSIQGTDWELMLRRHLRDGRIVGGM